MSIMITVITTVFTMTITIIIVITMIAPLPPGLRPRRRGSPAWRDPDSPGSPVPGRPGGPPPARPRGPRPPRLAGRARWREADPLGYYELLSTFVVEYSCDNCSNNCYVNKPAESKTLRLHMLESPWVAARPASAVFLQGAVSMTPAA